MPTQPENKVTRSEKAAFIEAQNRRRVRLQ